MFQRFISTILFILILPILIIFYVITKCTSKGPFFYKQKRVGLHKKPFFMYKVRTMIKDAEELKKKYLNQNEADGPVFKIKNDPRFTAFGRWLSHHGFDEIPQLINIIKGEMAFVGPRPLPLDEAKEIDPKYQSRFNVLPGLTSPWVIQGLHKLTFKEWMELDVQYVKEKNLKTDSYVFLQTFILLIKNVVKL